jgi:hypothetical protein
MHVLVSCSINTNPTNSEDIFIGFALAKKTGDGAHKRKNFALSA